MTSRTAPIRDRRRWPRTIVLIAAVALPLAFHGAFPGSGTYAQGREASPVEVRNAIAFRESFGLEAGRSFVEGTMTDPAYSQVPYSIPLSEQELADMGRRLDVQMTMGPAVGYAMDQPGYAGVYLDQDRQGRPTFLFTRKDGARDSEIGRRLGDDVAYDVREVDHSLDRLNEVKYEVIEDISRIWDAGVFVVEVGPDVRRNTVQVGVEGLDAKGREYLERYGPEVAPFEGVTAQADACTVSDCSSAKAGLKIVAPNHGHCTQGPYVRRGSANRIITAGHCFGLNGGSGKTWEHNNEAVAESNKNTWSGHAHTPGNPNDLAATDAGIFLETAQDYEPNELNKLVIWDDDANVLRQGHLTSWAYSFAQVTGSQVCRTGWKSFGDSDFPSCGKIVQMDHWQWSCAGPGTAPPCAAIDHEWKVDFDTTGGDSGGPYYTPPSASWNARLYGIATHSVKDSRCEDPDQCRAWYTPASSIMTGFASVDVTISRFCVDADCGPVTCTQNGCAP